MQRLVEELMSGRRVVRDAKNDPASLGQAPRRVDEGNIALGERDPVWWTDGEPHLNRHLVKDDFSAAV